MKSKHYNLKSYVRLYWILWGVELCVLITTRVLLTVYFSAIAEHLHPSLQQITFWIYFLVTMPALLLVVMFERGRLNDYMDHQHNQHLCYNIELTFFLTSEDNFDDSVVDWIKANYKRVQLFCVIAILTVPILACVR